MVQTYWNLFANVARSPTKQWVKLCRRTVDFDVHQPMRSSIRAKAKQLSWDRAYDSEDNLCVIGYYDAGNAAYAGS